LKFLFVELPLHFLVEVALPGIFAVGIIAFIIFAAIALIKGAFMLLVLLVDAIREKIHPKEYEYFPFNCKGCPAYDAELNRCRGIHAYYSKKYDYQDTPAFQRAIQQTNWFPTEKEDCQSAHLDAIVRQQILGRINQTQNNGDGE